MAVIWPLQATCPFANSANPSTMWMLVGMHARFENIVRVPMTQFSRESPRVLLCWVLAEMISGYIGKYRENSRYIPISFRLIDRAVRSSNELSRRSIIVVVVGVHYFYYYLYLLQLELESNLSYVLTLFSLKVDGHNKHAAAVVLFALVRSLVGRDL